MVGGLPWTCQVHKDGHPRVWRGLGVCKDAFHGFWSGSMGQEGVFIMVGMGLGWNFSKVDAP